MHENKGPQESFLSDISWKHLGTWFKGRPSLFRQYQTQFLSKHAAEFSGRVIELGGETQYRHSELFLHVSEFVCTNVDREFDHYVDVTDMKDIPDQSVDGYIGISLFEHVFEYQKALREIDRTLKSGGRLLLTVPFAFPVHEIVDYWRFGKSSYARLLPNYTILDVCQLGGMFSTLSDVLQHPRKQRLVGYVVCKVTGLFMAMIGKFADRPDDFPLGYGIYAVKGPEQTK